MPMPSSSNVSSRHEQFLVRKSQELQREGWRVIFLSGKIPDAIAVKGGKICAVEVLAKYQKKRSSGTREKGEFKWSFSGGATLASKRRDYHMFDDVIFETYRVPLPERKPR